MQKLSELPFAAGAMPAQLLRQDRRRHKALERLRQLRQQARDEIDRLIQFLDDSDLDPDLEETGDLEPSLGWLTSGGGLYQHSSEVDCEAEDEHDEPDVDGEPSLGACNVINQSMWGLTAPRLKADADLEVEDDTEPSLGWTIEGRCGGDSDCELNEAPTCA